MTQIHKLAFLKKAIIRCLKFSIRVVSILSILFTGDMLKTQGQRKTENKNFISKALQNLEVISATFGVLS